MSRLRPSAFIPALALSMLTAFAVTSEARAWEKHQSLMNGILSGIKSSALDQPLPSPCAEQDRNQYAALAIELGLNPNPSDGIPHTVSDCKKQPTITGREILSAFATDEPDMGMDRDLVVSPETHKIYDPSGFQKWMGGSKGPTSQGFRHMYFGGWQPQHPLRTFQIPTTPVGYAPERAALMAHKAHELIRQGGTRAVWGYRVLGWAIHYVQDLAQPFHAVQIPSLQMVPFSAALEWPPQQGFEKLVKETTRTISNYHFAFEAYTLHILNHHPEIYFSCLASPPTRATPTSPLELAMSTVNASVKIGGVVGRGNVHFFGSRLKETGVDLPAKKGEPDYATLATQPGLESQRDELTQVTCKALGNAAWASRTLVDWAIK